MGGNKLHATIGSIWRSRAVMVESVRIGMDINTRKMQLDLSFIGSPNI